MNDVEMQEIITKICDIISQSTAYTPEELEKRKTEHLHTGLDLDSLTLLEVALVIDQEFETDFSEEKLLGMETVEKAAGMVSERLAKLKEGVPA